MKPHTIDLTFLDFGVSSVIYRNAADEDFLRNLNAAADVRGTF